MALAAALESNTTLTELHLRRTGIGDKGAMALAEANTTLAFLGLEENDDITADGLRMLAAVLERKTNLTINLPGISNEITADNAELLGNARRMRHFPPWWVTARGEVENTFRLFKVPLGAEKVKALVRERKSPTLHGMTEGRVDY
eukprot:3174807-Prymnesium_polylepis.1